VKIIPRVGPFDHHHKEIAPVIQITIADRRFEFIGVLFDPILQINRWLDGGHTNEGILAAGRVKPTLNAPAIGFAVSRSSLFV
jgi:hypothetical protein